MLDALADPRDWPDAAASLVANLGFRLMAADQVGPDDSHLLVAFREQPALTHFDPEAVAYYAPARGGANVMTINRHTPGTVGPRSERQALWGHVHVLDRVPVENRFLTFGGVLRMAEIDSTLTVVDLWSPAPIVRWGGHSQGTDGLAEAIGAFFGRLIVPVDFVRGAATRIDAVPPEILYRAFLAQAVTRSGRSARRVATPTDLDAWLRAAWARAESDPASCVAARAFLEEFGI